MFGREPAAWLGVIQAGFALAVGFGLNITTEQMGLIMAFSSAVFAAITRANVTPNKDVATRIDGKPPAILLACALAGGLALQGCATNPVPNLSPEGKVAFYGEKFMSGVAAAQDQTIALVGRFGITRADVTPAVEVFVMIGKAGQELAAELKVIDESTITEAKHTSATRVKLAVTTFQELLSGLLVRIQSAEARTQISAILSAVKIGATLLEIIQHVAPFLQQTEVSYAAAA